jgi:hypothetical protein
MEPSGFCEAKNSSCRRVGLTQITDHGTRLNQASEYLTELAAGVADNRAIANNRMWGDHSWNSQGAPPPRPPGGGG